MKKSLINCPNNHGEMILNKLDKSMVFRGENIVFKAEAYLCETCHLEIATIEQAAAAQNAIADAYRQKLRLLTGTEIRRKREQLGLTQKKLAKRAGVGVASIKRWESGAIQTKSMNAALKAAFQNIKIGNNYTGNHVLSIPRIKLVMKEFENELGHKFLEEGDMMLFDAKYLFYADMLAYHRLGKSLTGATYTALPYGPQLNNYKDLVELIQNADENTATPLTPEEKKIIVRVALTFPTKQSIIDASHREEVWKNKLPGNIILYSDAEKLTEIQI